MKVTSFAAALVAVATAVTTCGPSAQAATITQWTIEGATTPADLTDSAVGPAVAATTGVGVLTGVHAGSASDWTTPSGPASANAYSVNTWATGDYFQFSTSTVGYENIKIAFDATGSNTGPRDFKLAYSTDGVSFTDFGTYSLINAAWSADVAFVNPAAAHFEFDLSAVTGLDNALLGTFRLIQVGTTSINAGTVASGGTSRVDNVTVSGDGTIPEPATLSLAGIALASTLLVRRRS
jgi:hypothetical protein